MFRDATSPILAKKFKVTKISIYKGTNIKWSMKTHIAYLVVAIFASFYASFQKGLWHWNLKFFRLVFRFTHDCTHIATKLRFLSKYSRPNTRTHLTEKVDESMIFPNPKLPIKTHCKVFENLPKSRIHHCERSELRLHFEWTKIN